METAPSILEIGLLLLGAAAAGWAARRAVAISIAGSTVLVRVIPRHVPVADTATG